MSLSVDRQPARTIAQKTGHAALSRPHSSSGPDEVAIAVELVHVLHSWIAITTGEADSADVATSASLMRRLGR